LLPHSLKVETLRPCNRSAAIIHDKMISIQLLLAALFVFMARLFFSSPSYPLTNFPEIARGNTCVHLLTPSGIPYTPAVMLFQMGKPNFIDIYTNQTAAHYRGISFRKIYMTSPVYRRKSLHQTLTGRPLFQTISPAVQQIFDNRNATWWTRCHRHWMELRQR
jgi:hypothetical protein